jgi:phosphoglycolate phosphatase
MTNLRPPRAIAFDLDGTLIDARLDIAAACNHVLRRAGAKALPPDLIATFVGDGARALLARAFGVPDVDGDERLDAWAAEFVEFYAAHPVDLTCWMTGALTTLEAVAAVPLALVTNKARLVTERVLVELGMTPRFAFVYAGGDGPLKPDAAPLLAVAGALDVEPADLWMVGDGAQDVLAARRSGACSVGVTGGLGDAVRLRLASPDATLSSIAELPALVRASVERREA